MNVTLRDQLILLEQNFLIAVVAQDEVAFEDFALELSRLTSHFNGIEANKHLDDSTTLLLSRVSQVITATCDSMLECEAFLGDAQKCSLSGPVLNSPSDDSLSMSITPPTFTPYHLLFCRVSSSGTHDIIGRNKLLDTRAYRWLMKNMHNPYPTSTQMQAICCDSMTSVAKAELWFQEVRDSIGWTRLSQDFFRGSIDATITAAKQVYMEHNNTIPFGIAFAFKAVKAFVETLFLERPASLVGHVTVGSEVRTVRSPPPPPG